MENTNYMQIEKKFKARYEYCHINNEKIVITKTSEIEDLVTDYAKSINDFFKTLMVFFIFIPIFMALSVVLYHIGYFGISLYSGSFALFFVLFALYSILFTSGSPVIYRDKIVKIQFKKNLFFNGIVIRYKDFGRVKKRGILLTNNQTEMDTALEILLAEKLIEEKNIENKGKQIDLYSYAFTAGSIALFITLFMTTSHGTKAGEMMMQYGIFMIIICILLLTTIIRNLISSIFFKINNSKKKITK